MSSSSSSLSTTQQTEQEKQKLTKQTKQPINDEDELNALVLKYLQYERVSEHKKYIEKLIEDNNIQLLQTLVGKRLLFGTAGIRGSMGPGFAQMNDLVIIQTSQGLVSYLLELNFVGTKEQGVIIGYDARHNSSRFARLTALAFLQKNIPVYFCEHIIPTPLIAFGVKYFKCCAGIVITASHNPKNDNGYKVYFANGAQILSPHDKKIQEHILLDENQQPWHLAWNHELLLPPTTPQQQQQLQNERSLIKPEKNWNEQLLSRVHGDLSKAYFSYIKNLVGDRQSLNRNARICITYTAMHGVGHMFLARAMDIAGFDDFFPVELQKKPDPEFSTVKFPNPEETGALNLAFETAKHANSNLILANDPDVDRCAAALYDPNSDYKRIFTGNELGSLLGWWIWHCYVTSDRKNFLPHNIINPSSIINDPTVEPTIEAANNQSEKTMEHDQVIEAETEAVEGVGEEEKEVDIEDEPRNLVEQISKRKFEDCYMISTAVSSKFLQSMAKIEGFKFVETLTGFKYMGNITDELVKKHDKCVLFAYEEAIGYMVDSTILDKDGISAAIQLAQCAAYVSTMYNRTLEQHLDWLYTRYGYHFNLNSYYICSDQEAINEIFTTLQKNYPKNFGINGEFNVTRVRDLNNGFDSGTINQKATLPCSSNSFMVTFFIDTGITFTIRTSGTEPKIKYYSEIISLLPVLKSKDIEENNFNDDIQLAAKRSSQDRLRSLVQSAVECCLRPSHYDLEAAD